MPLSIGIIQKTFTYDLPPNKRGQIICETSLLQEFETHCLFVQPVIAVGGWLEIGGDYLVTSRLCGDKNAEGFFLQ